MLQSRIFSFPLIPRVKRKNWMCHRLTFEYIAIVVVAVVVGVMFCSFFDRAATVDSFSMNYGLDCVLWLECVMV